MSPDARIWVLWAWIAIVFAAAAGARLIQLRAAFRRRQAVAADPVEADSGTAHPGAARREPAPPLPRAAMRSILAAALSVVSAAGWGHVVLSLIFPDLPLGAGLGLVARLALGWGLLSYLTLAIGLVGRITTLWMALLHAPGFALGCLAATGWLASRSALALPELSIPGLLAAGACLVVACIGLVSCFAPPRGWDAHAYHLVLPRRYAAQGSIRHVPYMAHSPWPQAVHMLYVPGFLLRATHHAQLLSWTMGLGLAVLVLDEARGPFGWEAAWVGCLALLMIGEMVFQMADASVDVGLALFTGSSILAFAHWMTTQETGFLLLSAVLAGLAAATKISALLWVGLGSGAAALTAGAAWGASAWSAPAALAGFAAPAMLVACPWYIRSAILTGNPVYHFATKLFRTSNWPPSSEQAHRDVARAGGWGGVKGRRILAYPFVGGLKDPSGWGAGIVALAPLGLMWPEPAAVLWAGLLSAALALLTLASTSQIRLLLGCGPGLALLAGQTFFRVSAQPAARPWHAAALTLAMALLGVGGALHLSRLRLAAALRPQLGPRYLLKYLPYYEDYAWINRHLAPDVRLLIWTTRGWLLERDYIWLPPWQQGIFDFTRIRQAAQFHGELKRLGVTHVYFTDAEIQRSVFAHLYALHEEMVESTMLVEQKRFGGSRVLYRLA